MGGRNVLAVDLGASGGRAILGRYENGRLATEEVHRFENQPVEAAGTLYWDVLALLREIKQGMANAKAAGGFESLAVDTWGVDYGLLTEAGELISNPIHYRDGRTAGLPEQAGEKVGRERFYRITGIEQLAHNTVYQLLADAQRRPGLLGQAATLLLMPDLLGYFLCGQKRAEVTIASTSQLLNAKTRDWSRELIETLGLPGGIFPPVAPSGTALGPLNAPLCEELGFETPPVVIAACGHDTQCAQAAVPAEGRDFAFVSCGTWALMGTELDAPVLTDEAFALGLSNESGYGGKTSFLKNITGLWLIQESRRQWRREGAEYGFQQLEDLAAEAPPLQSFVNPNDPAFAPPGNLPRRIRVYCEKTGQPVPESPGAVVRCINESLALQFRKTLGEISRCTGKTYATLHMLGGGVKSPMLCQMAADACGCTVLAGPNEATVWGNLAVQLIALGELDGLAAARAMVRQNGGVEMYTPQNTTAWQGAYDKFRRLVTC